MLWYKGKTVVDAAATDAEETGGLADEVDGGVDDSAGDGVRSNGETVLFSVEEGGGVDGALEVQTGQP